MVTGPAGSASAGGRSVAGTSVAGIEVASSTVAVGGKFACGVSVITIGGEVTGVS
jgi:hypothetical protein